MRLGEDDGEERRHVHRHPAAWSVGMTPWLERSRATRAWARVLREGLAPAALDAVRAEATTAAGLRTALGRVPPMKAARVPLPDAIELAPEPIAPTRVAPAPAPVAEPPPPVLVRWSGDAAAQAEALIRASANGTPFCAVCEAARREAEWQGDAEAQAATLLEAAEDGTPFCEECEAAARQEAS
ncbi:MAG: hypothetical protein H6719_19280 [Sandaracinaceae bacterium]|nr:hypothetical protein [Sandaracinaceae bacterium]